MADPLEALLRPVVSLLNREIAARSPARALANELDGRMFALRVRDTGIAMSVRVDDGVIRLASLGDDEPDVAATGSLVSLARLAGPSGEALLRDGTVDIVGDPSVADRFRKLLRYGRPDAEEALSSVLGDAAAHSVGEFLRGVGRWSREAGATMERNVGEYLQEESRAVPGRYEVDAFRRDVRTLQDDVARFEARLKLFEEALD
jgi:ubiquinone biosynthesis protein UbiJ